MKTMSMQGTRLRMRLAAVRLFEDSRGVAATEFAFILPVMLVMLFGTIELSSGVAVDRKVTLIARTLSDLTSQAAPDPAVQNANYAPVNDTYLQNVFTASIAILNPYDRPPARVQLSEIYVDTNKNAKIVWSRAAIITSNSDTQATLTNSTWSAGTTVTGVIPAALLVKQTYLIFSEVSYNYKPLGIGYVMKTNVNLADVAYSRPRQVLCLVYNNVPVLVTPPTPGQCPTT
jgi:Flp pilus assembly protein TadG